MQNMFTMIANVSGIRLLTVVLQKTSHGMLLNIVTKDYTDIFLANKNKIAVNTSKGIQNGYPYFYCHLKGLRRFIWVRKTVKNVWLAKM